MTLFAMNRAMPLLAMLPLSLVLSAQTATEISGSVVDDESGLAVAGALVSASRVFSAPTDKPHLAETYSATNGSFSFKDLPEGDYQVCVQATGSEYLSSCEWRILDSITKTKAGQPVKDLQIRLERGRVVEIRVDDPAKALEANEGKTPGVGLMVGIYTERGFFAPARITASDASGRTYTTLIPFDKSTKVAIVGRRLNVEDDKGTKVRDTDTPASITEAKGQAGVIKRLRYIVKGLE